MSRMRTEVHTYCREQLSAFAMFSARLEITGKVFIGEIGEQSVIWNTDGSVRIETKVVEK